MHNIRDIASGTKKESRIPTQIPFSHSEEQYGAIDYEIDDFPTDNAIKRKLSNEYRISMIIDHLEIGDIAKECKAEYNWQKADKKAKEIAYDRLETLLGKNYESKHTISFTSYAGHESYEIEILLTPLI